MLFLYSLLYTFAILLMSPLFLLRRKKYASGFRERSGNYPQFKKDGRKVIWLHCVSVGETNAARPLIAELKKAFPSARLVISTTTKTGNDLAKSIFTGKADAIFYFPFDWKFSVRRALRNFHPSLILLMETEIWPRLIIEAKRSGAEVAIVNGRLSQRSFERYSLMKRFVRRIFAFVDLALMQSEKDSQRLIALGLNPNNVQVTGNLKFDLSATNDEARLADDLKKRFQFDGSRPLIVAASTHEPEEKWIIESLRESLSHDARLLIAPRHPERFDTIAKLLADLNLRSVRRSNPASEADRSADVVLLDSVGELRAVFRLADIVFVGGSLIPHGGQSILEPAMYGKAIITGPYTHNFNDVVNTFLEKHGLIQLLETNDSEMARMLTGRINELLHDPAKRVELGENARSVIEANRGATTKTVSGLKEIFDGE
jgi:3-deoxy-D-manno-octulosonic-acid transferase